MCGIFFSIGLHEHVFPDNSTDELLKNRGPDSRGVSQTQINRPGLRPLYATFISTVLSLRGTCIAEQPLKDSESGSVLCWNGEAWSIQGHSIEGNDSQTVFAALLQASLYSSEETRDDSLKGVVQVLASIRGPYALVYYDARNGYIYYGRDPLGRRSLLQTSASGNDALILSSVSDYSKQVAEPWREVEADGLYVIDLYAETLHVTHMPHHASNCGVPPPLYFPLPFPHINATVPPEYPSSNQEHVHLLETSLRKSLELRIKHVRESVEPSTTSEVHSRVAVLFSGGLDCTILARLSHDLLPATEPIDLLNVAFENPRIHRDLDPGVSAYDLCPDRLTGRASYAELLGTCPGRTWRFVEINVPYTETLAHRGELIKLIHPHNTEMDLSIAYALYFASRGVGLAVAGPDSPPKSYTTTAHVLLSGLGADELFGGYQRHAVSFSHRGYPGLIEELALDFNRLGKRNLGRDDRVISDSGREVRFPYLDEDFITLALELPVWAKCDFGNAQDDGSDDPARFLEPGKRALRMMAWNLGMKGVAREKKRAIQFGARTAKMETGRSKGTQLLS